ncbi:MAG: 2OG-Fe(II) oxygenase [Nitrospiraceae bacterium]|nr:2OG-Fe(II) oxygenase [Nitrospiraceae bacterium]
MRYLNYDIISGISDEAFRGQTPYPWVNISNVLTAEGFERLRGGLPEVSLFDKWEGVKRGHGQGYHDRYILHYQPGLALSEPWRQFIAEVQGKDYEDFIRRMIGRPSGRIILTMEWYYGWRGCAVSPHCDARRKAATQIFYFNTEEDWKTDWGGNILIMDDGGRFKAHSAPPFDELRVAASLDPRGNGSLLFMRTDHSWHGVRPLGSPDGPLRKLFIITINTPTFQVWWRRVRGKDPDGYRMRPAPGASADIAS